MPKIKNVSPLGDLEIPLLGRVVEAGETVEVTDEEAETLLAQPDNFHPVGPAAKKIEKEVTHDDDSA
jgi:hypothetical protein